jgi:hypothetical protein
MAYAENLSSPADENATPSQDPGDAAL